MNTKTFNASIAENRNQGKKIFLIIDGNNSLANNYFGVKESVVQKHLEENKQLNLHIYTTTRRWLSVIEKYKFDKVMFVFDSKEKPVFRKEIFPSYKVKSKPKPLLEESIQTTKKLLDHLYLDYLSIPGYEADDVIATLVEKYKKGYQIYIWSNDKDLYQLVDKNVSLVKYDKFNYGLTLVDEKYIYETENLSPSEYLQYKIIYGDKSNNTPGIPGLYWTSLVKQLLREYKTIDNILQIKYPTKKVKRIILNITLHWQIVELNRKLIILVKNVDLKQGFKSRRKIGIGNLYAFCKKQKLNYEFFKNILPFFLERHKEIYGEVLQETHPQRLNKQK